MGCSSSRVQPEARAAPRALHLRSAKPGQINMWYLKLYGFNDLKPLMEVTTLVCIKWLVRLGRAGGIIPPWQSLPREAHASVVELSRFHASELGQLPILALSYPWLARGHPDPQGLILRRILPLLELLAQVCDRQNSTVGVLWDFMSYPQRGYSGGSDPAIDDRSESQKARFRSGLSKINVFHAAARVIVLRVDVPIATIARTKVENDRPIENRGWCIFECQMSSMLKDTRCFLSLAKYYACFTFPVNWEQAIDACRAGRPAPLDPTRFEAQMRTGITDGTIAFTAGADLDAIVLPNYREGFMTAMSSVEILEFGHLGWGDEEIASLTISLVAAAEAGAMRKCYKIALHGNNISSEGALALATTLNEQCAAGRMPELKVLILAENDDIDDDTRMTLSHELNLVYQVELRSAPPRAGARTRLSVNERALRTVK